MGAHGSPFFVHLRTVMARSRLLESLDSPAVVDATAGEVRSWRSDRAQRGLLGRLVFPVLDAVVTHKA